MKIKEEFRGLVIGRRFNGKMIEFDTRKEHTNLSFYMNNGFSDVFTFFEEEVEDIDSKAIYFTNDEVNMKCIENFWIKDVPNDKRNYKNDN